MILKSKRGDALLLGLVIVFFAICFTALIVDIGYAYVCRVQLQHIADAAAIGGANWAARAFKRPNEPAEAIVQPEKARPKADEIVRANRELLPPQVKPDTFKATFNPDGVLGMTDIEQYYSGNFTVRVEADSVPFLLSSPLFGRIFWIPYRTEARMHVTPVTEGGKN